MKNTTELLERYYFKKMQELNLLDKLMILDTDYSRYDSLIENKVSELIEELLNKPLLFEIALNEACNMPVVYYQELLDYEQEVIKEELERELHTAIIDKTQKMYGY